MRRAGGVATMAAPTWPAAPAFASLSSAELRLAARGIKWGRVLQGGAPAPTMQAALSAGGEKMKDWMKLIPESELATYKKAGFMSDMRLGQNPALIVVDVTFGFTGLRGQTLEESIDMFGSACGPVSWEAIPKIAELIAMFRARALPVVFTNSDTRSTPFTGRATKSKRVQAAAPRHNDFPDEVMPREGEYVLGKTRASAFFQTPLTAYLIQQKVDTLVFCGVSTSGCVRASVVDGFSHGYSTFVVDECCFDRSPFAHAANLFDMNAKYASVLSLGELAALMPAQTSTRAA